MAGPIPLPSEIQVEETLDGVRYTLPKKVEKNRAGGCAGAGLLVFGLAFGGFAAFWICMAAWGMAQSDEHIALRILFPAFGTPFLLIGLGLIGLDRGPHGDAAGALLVGIEARVVHWSSRSMRIMKSCQVRNLCSPVQPKSKFRKTNSGRP